MRILIDGDGCPVIGLTLELAGPVPVWVFSDVNHRPGDIRARWVTVDAGRDSADLALANRAQPGDIVVTQDYALAALALARGAACLHQDGWRYDEAHIDGLLASRHDAQRIRRAGGRTKGPHRRGKRQDEQYAHELTALLAEMRKNEDKANGNA